MNKTEKLELYTVIRNIRHRYKLDQLESGHLGQILPMVDQARNEILSELEARFDTDRWSDRRNAELLAELERLSQGVKKRVGGEVEKAAGGAYEKSAQEQSDIYTLEGRAANVAMLQLSQEQIQQFLDTPVGGRHLQEWVKRSFDQPMLDKLQEEMGAGLFRGESYRKLADRMDELMGEARGNVEVLTRAWVQDANVRAQKDMLDKNRDIVRGWRWDAVLENASYSSGHGTCLRCMALDADDTVYSLDGGPTIPLHPACRCVRRTVTRSWEELGVSREGLDEAWDELSGGRPYAMRGMVDPVTGEFKRGKTGVGGVPLIEAGRLRGGYSEFFQRMPERMKRQSLGPQRFALLKEGKIKLSDLADSSGRQRTIQELKELAR